MKSDSFAACTVLAVVALLLPLGRQADASPAPTAATPAVDPVPLRVDLPRAIALATRNSPALAAAQSSVDVATAQRDKASAEHWPSLRAQAGFAAYRRPQRLFPAASPGEPAVVGHPMVSGDLLLYLPLYLGGRTTASVEAAEAVEQAARHTSSFTRDELVFEVTAAYFEILARRRMLAALASSEQALVQHVDKLAALVEERKAAPVDRQRLEVRLAAIRQRRALEESALRMRTAALRSLLGLAEAHRAIEVVGELGPPSWPAGSSPEPYLRKALAGRSDYQAMQALVRAEERRIDVARAGHLPRLSVQGSYGLRWDPWPNEQPDGASPIADVGQIGLYADLPIFEGGRVEAEIRERQAALRTARERLRQTGLTIRLEVESALLDVQTARERIVLSETTIAQAKEAFRVETEKQALGKSTVSEVLSAQSDLLDAEASRAQALADANVAAAALRVVTGEAP